MNSSQACFFHFPLRPISLSHSSYAFVSKRDPFLCSQAFRSRKCSTMNLNLSRTRERHFRRHLLVKERKSFSINYSDKLSNDSVSSDEMHTDALDVEIIPTDSEDISISQNSVVSKTLQDNRPKFFRNRFLDFVRISSALNTAAQLIGL
ncbi:Preprotein translocase subunit SCY2 [Cardamine amara subsp. amara]|uniref:Preprotein translocase subunit SCY2 n=1 Tax=Cardamine amara subsp. amara TaxID=228776 RepID=A0ABD1AQ93_CARAN